MPPFGKSKPKPRVVKRRLADGTVKEYRYDKRKRESRLDGDTIGALAIAYRASPEWLALAERTRRNRTTYLREIERLQAQKVASITRRALLDIRDKIAAVRGNGAASGFIAAASALFGWAVEREWITHTPVYRIKPLPSGHLEAWTWEQAEYAMQHLPEPYRRVVVLAVYTGQRRGDLIALPWSAIAGNQIRLTQGKTGTPLVLPIHPTLAAELATWRATAAGPIILTTSHKLPWRGYHLSHFLPKQLVKIGLPPLGIHGVRKLAAARLAETGASASEIAAVTGHKSLGMVALYTASADQERMASIAIARLPLQNADKTANGGKKRR